MTERFAALLLGCGVMMVAPAARGDQKCMYAQQFFSPGAVTCQTAVQFRCTDGAWQPTGLACSDQVPQQDQPGVLLKPGEGVPVPKEPPVQQPPVAGS